VVVGEGHDVDAITQSELAQDAPDMGLHCRLGQAEPPSDPGVRITLRDLAEHLIRMRTREGMKVARAKGRLRGKQPKRDNDFLDRLRNPARAGVRPAGPGLEGDSPSAR
jgi:hypothetical protein